MWSIIFSRSDSGNVSMAITVRLLLISPAPGIILVGRRCISDNLDAFGNPRDANLLQSQNFCANPPPRSIAPHPVRIEGGWKKEHSTWNWREMLDIFSPGQACGGCGTCIGGGSKAPG